MPWICGYLTWKSIKPYPCDNTCFTVTQWMLVAINTSMFIALSRLQLTNSFIITVAAFYWAIFINIRSLVARHSLLNRYIIILNTKYARSFTKDVRLRMHLKKITNRNDKISNCSLQPYFCSSITCFHITRTMTSFLCFCPLNVHRKTSFKCFTPLLLLTFFSKLSHVI